MKSQSKIDYNIQDKFDFGVFLPALMLMGIGLVAIYSSTVNHPTAGGNFQKQLFWVIVSLAAFFVVFFIPNRTFRLIAIPSYIVTIILLIAVEFAGKTVYGARSWLSLGPIGFQPSEFAKISTVLFLSYWLSNNKRNMNSIKDVALAMLIGFVPIILILMEPDLGTAIVFIMITLILIYWSGISLFGLFVVLSPGLVAFASLFGTIYFITALIFVLALLFFFKQNLFTSAAVFVSNVAAGFLFDYAVTILKPHQQKRIESFINPAADPLGSGYNALQAKVAIGSGGFWGKGLLEGNQTQLRFIPEQWTDFIYCVIGEEFGFIGSMFVIVLFLMIFLRLLKFTSLIKDGFANLVIVGILTILFVHFGINIGMNVGITPVVGLPLPFLSYGGSSLLANMILLGIAMNFYRNRKRFT
jgi:rod shape determining protein RodA